MTTNQGISAQVAQPPGITTGLMTVRDGRRLSLALFAGYGGSAGPWPLKYAGLGDVMIVPVMRAARSDHPEALRSLVPLTAQVHLAFCILLLVGVVLGRT